MRMPKSTLLGLYRKSTDLLEKNEGIMSREKDELGRKQHDDMFAPDWPFTENPKPVKSVEQGARDFEREIAADTIEVSKRIGDDKTLKTWQRKLKG